MRPEKNTPDVGDAITAEGSVSKAAEAVGLSERGLRKRLKRHKLEVVPVALSKKAVRWVKGNPSEARQALEELAKS